MAHHWHHGNAATVKYTSLDRNDASLALATEINRGQTDESKHGHKSTTSIELHAILPENEDAHPVGKDQAYLAPTSGVDDFDHNKLHRPLLWSPPILRSFSLIIFGVLFATMLVALEILRHFSKKNTGIAQAKARDYYLWTYGPTAGTLNCCATRLEDY